MRHRSPRGDWVRRLCDRLGRQTFTSGFLDWVASWFLPQASQPLAMRPPVGEASLGLTALMAQGPLTTPPQSPTYHGTAPTTPGDPNQDNVRADDRPGIFSAIWHWFSGTSHQAKKDQADRLAGKDGCQDPRYHGMHGRPCRFAGGTDLKCPPGTTSGWFWSYDTPAGRIFYVDCCGGTPQGAVWCNWTQETNWCVGWGRASQAGITAYNCTRDLGGGRYEVVGVDA
jgi:hypothetical protein